MVRLVVIVVIAAVAGLIGWLFFFGDCGGAVVRSAENCRAQRLDAALCDAFAARLQEFARHSSTSYASEPDCRDRHSVCVARENPRGWSPQPSALCVSRDANGGVARVEPVYEPAGARRVD